LVRATPVRRVVARAKVHWTSVGFCSLLVSACSLIRNFDDFEVTARPDAGQLDSGRLPLDAGEADAGALPLLQAISVDRGVLSPEFNPEIRSYELAFPAI
jgi:hypothetical protein